MPTSRRQGYIHVESASLPLAPRLRKTVLKLLARNKTIVLVHGNGQNVWIFVEDGLCTVAMVNVPIDNRDSLNLVFCLRGLDRKRNVGEQCKGHGSTRQAMMT